MDVYPPRIIIPDRYVLVRCLNSQLPGVKATVLYKCESPSENTNSTKEIMHHVKSFPENWISTAGPLIPECDLFCNACDFSAKLADLVVDGWTDKGMELTDELVGLGIEDNHRELQNLVELYTIPFCGGVALDVKHAKVVEFISDFCRFAESPKSGDVAQGFL